METSSHGTSIHIYRKSFIYGFYLLCDRATTDVFFIAERAECVLEIIPAPGFDVRRQGGRERRHTARLSISRVFTPNSMHSQLHKSSQQVARGVSDPPNMFADGLASLYVRPGASYFPTQL